MADFALKFLSAQGQADGTGMYASALDELTRGKKRNHWIWYIFPQVRGLSMSARGKRFEIQSIREAVAYLDHQVLGPRLLRITAVVQDSSVAKVNVLMGTNIDAQKLQASMTLFVLAADQSDKHGEAAALFVAVLDKFFGGNLHKKTVEVLVDIENTPGVGVGKASTPKTGRQGGFQSRAVADSDDPNVDRRLSAPGTRRRVGVRGRAALGANDDFDVDA